MSFAWGCVFWGAWVAVFAVGEGLALTHRVPWPSLSRTCWDLEDRWEPMRLVFLVFLAALLVHIVARLPLWIIAKRYGA